MDIEEFLDEDTGTMRMLDSAGKDCTDVVLPKPKVFDEDIANSVITELESGSILNETLHKHGLRMIDYSNWKKMNADFSTACKLAMEHRADALVERVYENDIMKAYGLDEEDGASLSFYDKRSKMALNQLKHMVPHRFKGGDINVNNQTAVLQLKVPDGFEKQLSGYTPQISNDGGLEV